MALKAISSRPASREQAKQPLKSSDWEDAQSSRLFNLFKGWQRTSYVKGKKTLISELKWNLPQSNQWIVPQNWQRKGIK